MKMILLKWWVGLWMIMVSLSAEAQDSEIFPLWPQESEENNGLKAEGKISGPDDSKQQTAELFVYRPGQENNTGMAVVICPGGGYTHLEMVHEGRMFADWLTERGITAIVLKYRLPTRQNSSLPLKDAQQSMRWLRSRAEAWHINQGKIGVAGFSAGGHLASTLATRLDVDESGITDSLSHFSCFPDFTILFYPAISMKDGYTHPASRDAILGGDTESIEKYSNELQVTARTPPTFLVHCDDDSIVSPLNSIVFYQVLKENKVPAALYIFPKGGHGWGLRTSFEYYQQWTSSLDKWLKTINKSSPGF